MLLFVLLKSYKKNPICRVHSVYQSIYGLYRIR